MGGGAIVGLVCGGLVVLASVAVVVLLFFGNRQARAHEAYVRENGEPVLGWVVQANSEMYDPDKASSLPAQLLITFDRSVSDDDMAELAQEVGGLKGKRPRDPDRAEVAELVTDERYRPFVRTKLPASVTGGPAVYSVHAWIDRDKLPNGVLDKPYIHCLAVREDPKSRVLMQPYPRRKRGRRDERDDDAD